MMEVEPACAIGKAAFDSEEECCAICFEHRPIITLPCSCRVSYCAACWDRALAVSIAVRGHAQCPSCRTAFLVDFDPDEGGLVYSPDAEGAASPNWRAQLYVKAQPVQIQLLRSFGAVLAGAARHRGDDAAPAAVAGGRAEAKAQDTRARRLPQCVCGAQLERVDNRGRILRLLAETDPDWRSKVDDEEEVIASLSARALVTCDLCGQVANRTGFVWTCQSGQQALLHPSAYDICEQCFSAHAGVAAARLCAGGAGGCWPACAALAIALLPRALRALAATF